MCNVLYIVVCPFVLFLLAIALFVLLRCTDSDYPFWYLQTPLVKTPVVRTVPMLQIRGIIFSVVIYLLFC